MKICGVELSGNDAVICLLQFEHQNFNLPDCRVRKLSIPKIHTRGDLQQFQNLEQLDALKATVMSE